MVEPPAELDVDQGGSRPVSPGRDSGVERPDPGRGRLAVVLIAREIRGRRREIHRRRHGPSGGLGQLDEGQRVELVAERGGIDPGRHIEPEVEVHVGEGAPAAAAPRAPAAHRGGSRAARAGGGALREPGRARARTAPRRAGSKDAAPSSPRAPASDTGALAELDDHPGGVLIGPDPRPVRFFSDVPRHETGRQGQRRRGQQEERQQEKPANRAQR